MKSIARRVSNGRLLGWVKAWLEMAVEEDDGRGGRRRTNRARHERKGTPEGSPMSPLFSNIYMRRFILGWKVLGYARHFKAEIVNYADDFAVLGRAPAAVMLATDVTYRREEEDEFGLKELDGQLRWSSKSRRR